jgi:membrane-associated phospholipid phosphatase
MISAPLPRGGAPPRALCTSLVLLAAPLGAQATTTEPAPPGVLIGRDAVVGGSFAAGTIVAHTLDRRLAERLQRPAVQANRSLGRTATIFRLAAEPGTIVVLPALWGAGRLFDRPTLADVGLHGSEAIVVAVVGVNVVKVLVGRARPDVNVHDPADIGFGRGLTRGDEYRSFPSGHTATAFAVASALTSEIMRRSPDARWAGGVPLYAAATMVGWSRMYDNRHWASDAVAGAGLGTVAGLAVVRFHHTRTDDRVDRWFLGASLRPGHVVTPIVARERRSRR